MMKTLPTSCSKAIIDKRKDVGFSCFFKDLSRSRAQLCLFPSKDVVRIRFLHLLPLPHSRLQPLLSSSSSPPSPDSQVDLENIETQPEQEIPSKTITVKFQLQKECSFGEQFFLVGNLHVLGLWDPESALPLTWSEGHVWTAELDMPVGVPIQFKFFLKTCTGNLLWQPDPDRIFESCETENTVIVCEDWDKAENQKVIVEEPIANEDGPLLDSEIAIVAENLTPPKEELVPETNRTYPGKEQLQALSEESATGDGDTSLQNPLAIVAENISYPTEDFVATADNGVLEDLGDNDRIETVDANRILVAYEGKPVLVPGLSPLEAMSGEEPMMSEDEKNSTSGASVGVNEALNHKLSESKEKQEPESEPREEETTAVIKDENEQLNQHIQEPPAAEEEEPDSESLRSNLLQSDVKWGRNALQKLLNGLRFL
ncbi:hypothetical protein V6N13_060070 [Hibiscus sabdariffa]|uniref:CBM20 domain-containing protein n=1 Tax=Hibiscus sabdariffa TaxID=183260 RepID=A0ABR2GB16_9ROSI